MKRLLLVSFILVGWLRGQTEATQREEVKGMKEVLIIVDMQRGFLEPGRPLYCGDAVREKVIPNVKELIEQKLKEGAILIFTQDSHKPDDPEFKMWPPHCIEGTEEEEIVPELAGYKGYRVKKRRYSAFFNTNLEEILNEIKPDKVTVCGVCTDICVLYTVADLRNRDYPVEVYEKCVASFDPEAHEWALKHMEKILGVKVIR